MVSRSRGDIVHVHQVVFVLLCLLAAAGYAGFFADLAQEARDR